MLIMKAIVPLVAFFTIQVVAQSRLASRQTTVCDSVCYDYSVAEDTCVTTECYCTPAVASSLQACANCFVTDTPVTSVISAVQALLDTYKSKCAGVLNPVLTIASNTLTTTPKYTPTRTRTSSKVFVTGVMTQTVTVGASTDASAVSNLPTAITKNSSSKTSIYWNTFVVAIGAMIGTALVL